MNSSLAKKIFDFVQKRILLLSLSLFLILINLHFYTSFYVPPANDTLNIFSLFYFFYNEYYFQNHIAQWMPNHAFGIPSGYCQISALTPVSYLAFFLGKLFNITDVFFLFKTSMLAEQFVLLLGLYLLSGELFKRKSTIFLVCVGALCSSFWHYQFDFQFRIYYLLPLASYLLILFHKKSNPTFFWVACMTILASAMGQQLYLMFFGAFVFVILNACLFVAYKTSWRVFLNNKLTHILSIISLIALLFCFYYQLKSFQDFVVFPYRGPEIKNSLTEFLNYGDFLGDLKSFFEHYLLGNSGLFYIGLIPFTFFVSALFTVRSKLFFAFLITAAAVVWFSFSGIFSAISYLFPGMPYYRHIGYVFGLHKILIAICAGFGLEHFWNLNTKTKLQLLILIPLLLIFFLDGLGITHPWLIEFLGHEFSIIEFFKKISLASVDFRLIIHVLCLFVIITLIAIRYFFAHKNKHNDQACGKTNRWIKILLIAIFLLDIYSYEAACIPGQISGENQIKYQSVGAVHKTEYHEQRHNTPVTYREKIIYDMIMNDSSRYESIYDMAQFGPCDTKELVRSDYVSRSVISLIEIKNQIAPQNYALTIGCDSPKLRLVPQAVSGFDDKHIQQLLKASTDLSQVAVLKSFEHFETDSKTSYADNHSTIRVTSFTTDHLTLTADVLFEQGAWLTYADAFHPAWTATVNGESTRIIPAHLAFNALHLNHGKNLVHLNFNNWKLFITSNFIALFGLLSSLLLTWLLIRSFLRPQCRS